MARGDDGERLDASCRQLARSKQFDDDPGALARAERHGDAITHARMHALRDRVVEQLRHRYVEGHARDGNFALWQGLRACGYFCG